MPRLRLSRDSLWLVLLVGACGRPSIEPRFAPGIVQPEKITVTSQAFNEGSRIPVDHTCDGTDIMPALTFSSPPPNTKSLILYVEDPDAPSGTTTHMVAFNMSPEVRTLQASSDLKGAGEGARFGLNDFGAPRYSGPCPPKGEAHRYVFRLIALDTQLTLSEGATRAQIDAATDGHILGVGTLMGHFGH